MKVKIPGINIDPVIVTDMVDFTFIGPLILGGIIDEPKDAVTKAITDTTFISLNADNFVTGTLSTERLPQQTGDVSSTAGNNTFTLNNVGVTPSTYPKVTVDVKGRTVDGSTLAITDIPSLNWNNITKNKPTNLTGYGITNGVKRTGDTVTGGLVSNVTPVNDLHAATKTYTDTVITEGASVKTGTIVTAPVTSLAGGFLRANGGEVSKTTYANLYTMIGDLFTGGNQTPGNGKPWKQQYEINTEQSANITGWATGSNLPVSIYRTHVIVTKNRVYLLGGITTAAVSTVYTAPINTDGTLGTWTTGTSLPVAIYYSQAIVTKNRVHLLGGYVNGTGTNLVYTAPIDANGMLGAWTTGTALPGALYASQAIVTKNRVYLLGGYIGSVGTATVYTAPINTDGTLGTWTTGASLPATIYHSQVVVTKNRVYLLGGIINAAHSNTVYTTPINTDGTLGTWTVGTSLPVAIRFTHSIVTKKTVYLLGGYVNGGSNIVYMTPINQDGTLGEWTTGINLPGTAYHSQVISTKNRIYLLGGYLNGSSATNITYTAPILGGLNDYSSYYNGTIAPISSDNFKLPDYSKLETSTEKYFIKY